MRPLARTRVAQHIRERVSLAPQRELVDRVDGAIRRLADRRDDRRQLWARGCGWRAARDQGANAAHQARAAAGREPAGGSDLPCARGPAPRGPRSGLSAASRTWL